MKRLSLLLMLFVLLGATARPVVTDVRAGDTFGIHVDPQLSCPEAFTPFDVYIVLKDPLAPFDGFECTVTWSGGPIYQMSSTLLSGGVDADPSANGFAVTAPTPYPVVGGEVVLAACRFFTMSNYGVWFYLGAATNPSLPGGLPAVSLGGAARLCPVYSCRTSSPVAWLCSMGPIDGPCFDSGVNFGTGTTVSAAGVPSVTIGGGTLSYATDGQDLALDFPTVLPTGSPYLIASFEHPDWSGGPRFRADYRARYSFWAEYRVWPVLVETDVDGKVTLDFFDAGLADPPLLHDLQTGAWRYFRSGGTYSFNNDGVPRSYRFELYGGEWTSTLGGIVGVPDLMTGGVGLEAWPNPFNPRTTLRFDLPRASAARLTVYDVAGRLVRALVDERLAEGAHEIAWDGRDDAGRPVGSGAYVARLEVEGAVSSSRLALLR